MPGETAMMQKRLDAEVGGLEIEDGGGAKVILLVRIDVGEQ
jgi:hypothetical protein